MWWPDALVLELLAPLAVWVLASGLDDLFLDLGSAWYWLRSRAWLGPPAPNLGPKTPPQTRVALLVPCWQEAAVIAKMLDRNLSEIRYQNYEIWVGLYPNDPESLEQVLRVESRDTRVRHVVGCCDGPTTKADNLNELFAGILDHERRTGDYYDIFLQHDAEDLVHPDSLTEADRLLREVDYLQLPVFPLPTPPSEWTHGVYADEFAEAHVRDLPMRARLGGFIPSAGVGTAIRREAVDRLRIQNGDRIFDPRSLTEDYFLGLEIWRLGMRQTFLTRTDDQDAALATRAYFPKSFHTAVKQRTRWIIGNSIQAWERFGWTGGLRQSYWLWRDRKGLVGHLATFAANLLFLYGLAGWFNAQSTGQDWALGQSVAARTGLVTLLSANLALFLWRQLVRALLTGRIYDWKLAVTAPLRAPWANLINLTATVRALAIYGQARLLGRPLRWSKTAHAFPTSPAAPEFAPDGLPALKAFDGCDVVPIAVQGDTLLLAATAPPADSCWKRLQAELACPLRLKIVTPEVYAEAVVARMRTEATTTAAATAGD